MTLGNTITQNRKKQNMTQEMLAQQLEVSNQAVSKWESDQCCPDIQLLPRLADIFGITIDELFGRTPEAEHKPVISGLPWKDDGTLRAVVYIGHRLVKYGSTPSDIAFTYEGAALNISSAFSVTCGNVSGNVDAGGTVNCGNISGSVDAGGCVYCGSVEGDVDAGGNVTCGDVGGDVDAGGNACCADVKGDVDAGRHVTCGSVSGNVDAGGDINIVN